jgi:hypothetical protein
VGRTSRDRLRPLRHRLESARLPASRAWAPQMRGGNEAVLCTFIRSSQESLKLRNSSLLAHGRMDNLMNAHS